MRALIHVERKTIDTAEVWVDVPEAFTHQEAIELAAAKASNEGLWELESWDISHGIGSYIKERQK